MELVDGLEVTEDGREHVRGEAAVARDSTVEHLGEGVSIVTPHEAQNYLVIG